MLTRTRLNRLARAVALATALLGAAVSLAACGRNGAPEPPPGPMFSAGPPPATPAVAPSAGGPGPFIATPAAAGPVTHEQAQKNGFDAAGNPVAPPSERKSFFLDFLLQ